MNKEGINMKKKFVGMSICMMMIAIAFVSVASADWPMYHHDVGNSGVATAPGLDSADENWSLSITGGVRYFIISDGKLIITSNDNRVRCYDIATKTKLWTSDVFNGCGRPVVYNGDVYVTEIGTTGGDSYIRSKICRINGDNGLLIWKTANPPGYWTDEYYYFPGMSANESFGNMNIANDLVYVTSTHLDDGSALWAINATTGLTPSVLVDSLPPFGDSWWHTRSRLAKYGTHIEDYMTDCPSPVFEDNVYTILEYRAGSDETGILCFDATPDDNGDGVFNESDNDDGVMDTIYYYMSARGDLVWNAPYYKKPGSETKYGFNVEGSLVCVDDRLIYLGGGWMVCFDATPGDGIDDGVPNPAYYSSADLIWITNTGSIKTPAVADGKIYSVIGDGLMCTDIATGNTLWTEFIDEGGSPGSPVVVNDKVYAFFSNSQLLYCFDSDTGDAKWSYVLIDVKDDFVVDDDGFIYLASSSKIYCIGENTIDPLPQKPNLNGPTYGNINVRYMFTITGINDTENVHDIYCIFDWGDGTDTNWMGPFDSSEITDISAQHAWSDFPDPETQYKVTAEVKHVYGEYIPIIPSPDPLMIDITYFDLSIVNITGGRGVSAIIENTGVETTSFDWEISITPVDFDGIFGAIIFSGGFSKSSGFGMSNYVTLVPGGTEDIYCSVFGIGLISACISITSDNELVPDMSMTKTGFLIGGRVIFLNNGG